MTTSADFGRFLEKFGSSLRQAGIENHPPQTTGVAAELADLLLTSHGDVRFFPKLALHLERWDAQEADLQEFRDFASVSPGPHDSFWLYLRLAAEADLDVAARHLASFVKTVWIGRSSPRSRITALEILRSGARKIELPRPSRQAIVAERLGQWLADASIGDVHPSGVHPLSRSRPPRKPSAARVGTIVGLERSGCWIELDHERYWAFYGSFRDEEKVAKLEEYLIEARRYGGLAVSFRPLHAADARYATNVCIV